jgi:hypothetical protein
MKRTALALILAFAFAAPLLSQQPQTPAAEPGAAAYKPKFPGDPARSEPEALALGYMRNLIRSQRQFNKHYGHYATTLPELVHSGSFTKRMVDPHQGDYAVSFKGNRDGYVLTLTPHALDATHRSFYAVEDGKIHADEAKPADGDSPVVR